jgi:hypothetical protein
MFYVVVKAIQFSTPDEMPCEKEMQKEGKGQV